MGAVWRHGWAVLLSALMGCLAPGSTECPGGGVCPPGLICLEVAGEQACILPSCGNGKLEAGEACDDGNHLPGDGCRPDCQDLCGNGVVDPYEACDDGEHDEMHVNGDGCSADCSSDETCGNGVVDTAAGESCDDGNLRSHDGCSSTCSQELPAWRMFEEVPGNRVGHALAYDASRGKVVLFGGCVRRELNECNGGFRNDIWEWDGHEWVEQTPLLRPPARGSHAMAYDAARGKIVLFGGCSAWQSRWPSLPECLQLLDDTWEWDGASWTLRSPPSPPSPKSSPPARAAHAMTYDEANAKVVMHGGLGGPEVALQDDTWSWNGATWTREGEGIAAPPPRMQHAMAYDAERRHVVMFGGRDKTGVLGDTWEWEATERTQWRERTSSGPVARASHAMAYAHGKVVLVGGCTSSVPQQTSLWNCASPGQPTSELWAWDGRSWIEQPQAVHPSDRLMHGLSYDAARERLVLFGGDDGAAFSSETWEWDGASWDQRTPAQGPPATLRGARLAYDASRGKVVLFGVGGSSETWEWDRGWTRRMPAVSPPPREAGAMAYDSARRRVVLFGGSLGGTLYNDLWEWDGMTWTQPSAGESPPPRHDPSLAYDAARRRLVLFGGVNGVYFDDTWEWDGATWTPQFPSSRPPARSLANMTYDVARQRVVLFGGELPNYEKAQDTWEWDGTHWTDRAPLRSASGRARYAMAYDPLRQRVVLFGGEGEVSSLVDDSYEWDGTTWSPLETTPRPPARMNHSMVYDTVRARMVTFGGHVPSYPASNTWILSFSSPGVEEVCELGIDADRDGKIGCEDPDCAGVCDPLCASFGVCEGIRPQCGDGTCSELEDCRVCPEDCRCP